MLHRFLSVLALIVLCNAAYSQQTQSPGLELKLEQFPEHPANGANGANGANKELQLDLKQFDSQPESKELELDLQQFDSNEQSDRGGSDISPTPGQTPGIDNNKANENLEVNLQQFEKDNDPSANSPEINSESTGNTDRINTSGSAATKIGDADNTTEPSDNMVLINAAFWLLLVLVPLFMFLRRRSRKRRLTRPQSRAPRPSFDDLPQR